MRYEVQEIDSLWGHPTQRWGVYPDRDHAVAAAQALLSQAPLAYAPALIIRDRLHGGTHVWRSDRAADIAAELAEER